MVLGLGFLKPAGPSGEDLINQLLHIQNQSNLQSFLCILMCLFCLKLTGRLPRGGRSAGLRMQIQLHSHAFLFTCLYKVG